MAYLKHLCQVAVESTNKVLSNARENADDKPKQRKQQTTSGKINISKGPLTTIQNQPETTIFDFETDLSRRRLFTEYYQSNEKSEILFLNNP